MSDRDSSSVLAAAIGYFEHGWQPIPIPRGKKAPRLKNWPKLRLRVSDLADSFSDEGNIGILLGEASHGLVDVDLDAPESLAVADTLLPPSNRIHGRKGKPRSHRWYLSAVSPDPEKFSDRDGTCLVEIRSSGQQTIVPPSIHPTGEKLRWEREGDPAFVDPIFLRRSVARVAAAALLARHWPDQGRRHEAALALSGLLLRATWTQEEAEHFVRAVALASGDDEWTARDADSRTTAQRLAEKGTATGRPRLIEIVGAEVVERASRWLELVRKDKVVEAPNFNFTDLGNARRFAVAHGADVRFCHPWNKWLIWDGRRWVVDEIGEVRRRAKQTVVNMLHEAATESEDERRKNLLAWEKQSEFEHRIRALISLAESEEAIPVRVKDLDRDPMLFNCQNGTLDLKTAQFRDHCREDLITKLAPVKYDAKSTCAEWSKFLSRVTNGDQELIDFLQRAAGYSLSGDISEHALFLLLGKGANGKSTFLEALRYVWGDYSMSADFSSFIASKGSNVRNDLARLSGARLVTAVESQLNRHLAEEVIKQITGGDTITARFLYREHFEFRPQFKLFLATNNKPRIRGTDFAIWRRIHLAPFDVTIPREDQDKLLPEKLRSEASGILRWAVEGFMSWQRMGLKPPLEVARATADYRSEQDVLQQFIEEICIADASAETSAADLYSAYRKWCESAGEFPLCKRDLGLALRDRGFQKTRSGTSRKWAGIRLSTETADA